MPRGSRTLGQVLFTRLEDEDGELGDPTEAILLRLEPDHADGGSVFARPPTDRDEASTECPTNQGRSLQVVVERADTTYLRTVRPRGWDDKPLGRFGLADGEAFQFDVLKDLPVSVAGAELFEIGELGDDDGAAVAPQLPAPALAPRQLGAAPLYAAGVGGPPVWVGPRAAEAPLQPPAIAAWEARDAPRFAAVHPELQQFGAAPRAAEREVDWTGLGPLVADAVRVAVAAEFGGISERMSRLEVAAPLAAPVERAPGSFFDPPARLAPVPAVSALGEPAARDSAEAQARALIANPVRARAATTQMLRLTAPGTTRAPESSVLHELLRALVSRDDLVSLLGTGDELGSSAGSAGAKGLAALERARTEFERNPRALWDYVQAQVERTTRVRGGGVLAYFEGTAVQHHELALFMLHLVDRISAAALAEDGDMVLGLCGSALTFLDQAARDTFSLRLASELAMMRDPELPYLGPENDASKRQRASYGKPFSPLVNPATYAAVTAAFKDIEILTKASAPAKGKGKGA